MEKRKNIKQEVRGKRENIAPCIKKILIRKKDSTEDREREKEQLLFQEGGTETKNVFVFLDDFLRGKEEGSVGMVFRMCTEQL